MNKCTDDQSPLADDMMEPTPAETLELLKAFNQITDPEKQEQVVRLAQQLADGSPRIAKTLAKLLRNRH